MNSLFKDDFRIYGRVYRFGFGTARPLAHVFYVFRLFYFQSSFLTVSDNLHAQERPGLAEISNFVFLLLILEIKSHM